MRQEKSLKVTACMASPIAGDVPMLDGLLEFEMSQRVGKARPIQRWEPAPEYGEIHLPLLRIRIGGLLVPCCSSPILSPIREAVEHFAKRFAAEHAEMMAPDKRRIIATGNSSLKSYRLPLRTRACDRIVWFVKGHRRPIKSLLRGVVSIGKKRSFGYGRVQRWELEWIDQDWSWFALSEQGTVLMRPLPLCDELPRDLIGYRDDFGACQSPYWHPDRFTERVVPV